LDRREVENMSGNIGTDNVIMSALSTDWLKAPVDAVVDGHVVDPTADNVAFAFVPAPGKPTVDTVWYASSWETSDDTGEHFARCKIGPNGGIVTLTKGRYRVFIRVTHSGVSPVLEPPNQLVIA
jgi:hypothetical protein